MNYHVYHHDDLDGIASSAIMLEFLKSKGDDFEGFHPVNYGTQMTSETWMNMKFKKPFMVFDFQFHPDATWWVDHHASAFRLSGEEFEKDYVNDKQHLLDAEAPSGTGVVANLLEEEHGHILKPTAIRLVKFLDKFDSATFDTLEEKLDTDNPYTQLAMILDDPEIRPGQDEYYTLREELIRTIALMEPEEIIKKHISKIDRLKKYIEGVNEKMFENSVVKEKVIYIDVLDQLDDIPDKSAAFLKHKDIRYLVIGYGKKDHYKIRCSWNNWAPIKPTLMMDEAAKAMSKDAGGHNGIGGFPVERKEDAMDALEKLTEYINKNG